MTNWLERGKHFAGAYLKGQVAAMDGKNKSACPYDTSVMGGFSQRYTQAWRDGFDSIAEARNDRKRLPQKT